MAGFVAYYRVSTDRQGRSGLGLDAQRQAVAQFVGAGDGFVSAGEIPIVKSLAKKFAPPTRAQLELIEVAAAIRMPAYSGSD